MSDFVIENEIKKLSKIKGIDFCVYGKSFLGQNLYAFHKGAYNSKQILITASIHAREYVSSMVVLDLLKSYNLSLGCYFVPLVNPDGVRLCLDGCEFIKDEYIKNYLTKLNDDSTDFKLWKANARGVDLNVNFDAGWGESKFTKNYPSSGGYMGEYPNSEIENKYLIDFVKSKDIVLSLNYHTKGKVIYYGFEKLCQQNIKLAKKYAGVLAKTLGYKRIQSKGSSGGLSDYLFYKHNIPSFTIELGSDKLTHPIGFEYVNALSKKQLKAIKELVKIL